MPENLILIIAGIIFGILFYKITVYLIEKKTQDSEKSQKIRSRKYLFLYSGLSVLGIVLILFIVHNLSNRLEMIALFCICLSIGWIDGIIRKIPNELLLLLILCKVVFLIVNHQLEFIVQGFIGLAAGFFIFMIPSFWGIPIGAGDIKYAAVIGFYLGILNLFQVILIMSFGLLAFLLYLVIMKKGNWKTAAAIGPYISFGVMLTALFPYQWLLNIL